MQLYTRIALFWRNFVRGVNIEIMKNNVFCSKSLNNWSFSDCIHEMVTCY